MLVDLDSVVEFMTISNGEAAPTRAAPEVRYRYRNKGWRLLEGNETRRFPQRAGFLGPTGRNVSGRVQ